MNRWSPKLRGSCAWQLGTGWRASVMLVSGERCTPVMRVALFRSRIARADQPAASLKPALTPILTAWRLGAMKGAADALRKMGFARQLGDCLADIT